MRDRHNYINGNLARKNVEKKQIKTRNYIKKNVKYQINKKAKRKEDRGFIFFLIVIFTMGGLLTITRYTKIYNMQKELIVISRNIQSQKEIQEDLRIKVMQFSSIKNIEEKAIAELNMFIPKEENIVRIDFSQDYFKDVNDKSPQE